MLPFAEYDIKSNNNKTFCHIFKKKFYDVDDTEDDSDDNNDDSNDDSDGEKLHIRRFHDDPTGSVGIDDDQYDRDDDNDNEEIDVRTFHGAAARPDDVDDNYYDNKDSNVKFYAREIHCDTDDYCDDEAFNVIRFHDGIKTYKRVHDHCHQTNTRLLLTVSAI